MAREAEFIWGRGYFLPFSPDVKLLSDLNGKYRRSMYIRELWLWLARLQKKKFVLILYVMTYLVPRFGS